MNRYLVTIAQCDSRAQFLVTIEVRAYHPEDALAFAQAAYGHLPGISCYLDD